MYISQSIRLYTCCRFKWKMEAQVIFLNPLYRLLIMQRLVCRLLICLGRNKRELSVCKRTEWTKRTFLSLEMSTSAEPS